MQNITKKPLIVRLDSQIPVILIYFAIALFLYSVSASGYLGSTGIKMADFVKGHNAHYWLMLVGLWPFFTRLGAELTMKQIVAAGSLVLGTIVGGMVLPVLLTTSLLYFYMDLHILVCIAVAAGAMATDVPMGAGAMKVFGKIAQIVVVISMIVFTILAVGDDLGGLIAMLASVPLLGELFLQTGLLVETGTNHGHGSIIKTSIGALIEVGILGIAWYIGQGGNHTVIRNGVATDSVIEIRSPSTWWLLAVFNTLLLGMAGIEPILGGCLIMIMAPENVKHQVENALEVPSLYLLFFFAIVAGSVNIFSPEILSWKFFEVALIITTGGFLGKFFGILVGGLIGRKFTEPNSEYGKNNLPWEALIPVSVAGGCNGTVAVFFVSVMLANQFIGELLAAQATIGYLLTVPVAYLFAAVFGLVLKLVMSEKEKLAF